jgi:hypothetical protein
MANRRQASIVTAATGLFLISVLTAGAAKGQPTPALNTFANDYLALSQLSPEAQNYTNVIVPELERRKAEVDSFCGAIEGATSVTAAELAGRLRSECLPPLQSLVDFAGAVRPTATDVRTVHDQAVAGLAQLLHSFESLALAYKTNDQTLVAAAGTERAQADAQWQAWRQAVAGLGQTTSPQPFPKATTTSPQPSPTTATSPQPAPPVPPGPAPATTTPPP